MPIVVSSLPKAFYERFKFEYPEGWEIRYAEPNLSEEAMLDLCRDADIVHLSAVHGLSAKIVKSLPKTRLIQSLGVAYNLIDYEAAAQVGIPVCNNQGANADSVAELTVCMMISCLRRISVADREIKAGRFSESLQSFWARGLDELCSQKVGLVGCGAIGRSVARMLIPFGCEVSYYDAFRPAPEVEKELRLTYYDLDDLLRRSDIISLHVPVLPQTINMISKPQFEMMKPNALVLNTSRGEVLDQKALAEVLEAGRIYGAAIDTLSPEPPTAEHPLLNLSPAAADRLLVTPHIAGITTQAFGRMLIGSLNNMKKVLANEMPANVVNKVTEPRRV